MIYYHVLMLTVLHHLKSGNDWDNEINNQYSHSTISIFMYLCRIIETDSKIGVYTLSIYVSLINIFFCVCFFLWLTICLHWVQSFENETWKPIRFVRNYHAIAASVFISSKCRLHMMTSSNGNIFRVTGHLCGEFTGPRWIPPQRPVTRSFDVYFDQRPNKRLSKQYRGWWFETLSPPLWRHRNENGSYSVQGPCDKEEILGFF